MKRPYNGIFLDAFGLEEMTETTGMEMLVDLLFHELRASPPGGSNLKNCSQRHRAKTKTRRFEPVASYCRAFRDLELYKPQ